MTASHDYFKLLCTLAASDELNEMEVITLRQHALDCTFCRNRILEMTQLQSHLLLAHRFHRGPGRLPEGMRERFIARAIAEGVPLTPASNVAMGRLGLASVLFASLLMMAAGLNLVVSPRSIANTPRLEDARVTAPVSTATLRLEDRTRQPARVSFPKRPVRQKGQPVRSQQRSLPLYLALFQNRDFSIRLNSPLDTSVRSRFAAPVLLRRSNALNLLANFQPGESPTSSRTFEFSDSLMSRFVRMSGCEPR